MSNIDKRALREAAVKAGGDKWQAKKISGDFYVIRSGSYEKKFGITSYQPIAEINHKPDRDFIAAANPDTVLALLDELEAKDAQIANLTAERDALREGEMGNAKHSNTRAAADIYFQLVEECEIPIGGSLVEYVSNLRERAAMLQSFGNSEQLNSPVIPDGWVACSERKPDKLIPVMVMYADGEMWSAIWTGTKWDDGTEFPDPHDVTHWQVMPAAPQQEVK